MVDGIEVIENSTESPDILLNVKDYPEFLPYVADVTEDISARYGFEPTTYKGCQLMTETHGPYLQFKDIDSGKVLRIAINSHVYFHSFKIS